MSSGIRQIRGCGIWVEDTGGTGPIVAFSHGLLWSAEMFRPQIDALRKDFRVVSWDHRGQGRSEVPATPSISIEEVTADAIELIETLGEPVHFVGLSMGGFVGMRIGARRPDLLHSLSLLETAPDAEPRENLAKYRRLMWVARLLGVRRFLANKVLPIMCARSFIEDPERQDDVERLRLMLMQNGRSIYKAVQGVLDRDSVLDEVGEIGVPTLVVRGTEDVAIALERARLLVERIEGADWVAIPGAGHTSSLEQPDALTAVLQGFLTRLR